MLILAICFLVSLVFLGANQGQNPQWKGKIKYEDVCFVEELCHNQEENLHSFENRLELKFSFPTKELEDKDIILYNAQRITSDMDGNIYLPCLGDHKILKFNATGKFIDKIGREGQGPGEFQGPHQVVFKDNRLIVLDNFSRKIQILDLSGHYLKGFHVPSSCWDMAASKNGLIYVAPIQKRPDKKFKLIEVYSQIGESKYSFGLPKDSNQDFPAFNKVRLAINDKDEIIMAFQCWPILHKYTSKGELLAEYSITHKEIRERFNLQQLKKPKKLGEPSRFQQVIDDIDVLGDTIFLFFQHYSKAQFNILELDSNLNVQSTYTYKSSDRYIYFDFLAKYQEGEKLFYMLQLYPENRVDVFGVNE